VVEIEKVKNVIAIHTRLRTRFIAKYVGISIGVAQTILRRDLILKTISARSILHLLTKQQQLARITISKQLFNT
jgi:hypothetical protein